ncbi:hypothetical protein J437_LFUL015308 [Ladona fulva]|uniref:Uncharacterized protein n=1 Tax=Ladona fulva TaxID=123851 RepID=A0A8K0KH15_LADFU|nr:hypothetical protein J437_LFUL015308 [Ladona fulva]
MGPGRPRDSRSALSDSGSRQTHTFHAVLDYDYDDAAEGVPVLDTGAQQQLQQRQRGPILVKNGSVPVVPLYSYPAFENGTLVQIPVSTLDRPFKVWCGRWAGGLGTKERGMNYRFRSEWAKVERKEVAITFTNAVDNATSIDAQVAIPLLATFLVG